jgi:alkyl hydroperoxide reductase subunit AhpC
MSVRLNGIAPDFKAETTQGTIHFHEWLGDSWGILFSHPKDFTPVCTTELGYMAKLKPEFAIRNVKVIGLSVDSVESHLKWEKDIEESQGYAVNYPMIGDQNLSIAKLYDMLPADEPGTSEGRTAVTNQTVRSVFVIGPDKKIKLTLTYPMTTGRNFDEILRVVDSMQLTANHKISTPVNWKNGEDVIIGSAVSNDEAKEKYPQGWKTILPYLRVVSQPGNDHKTVHYKKNGIATFPATIEDVFKYMREGNHQHAAFKSHKLVNITSNEVTVEAEIFNPDGSTFQTTITHKLNPPKGIETTMSGGAFSGARFTHSYAAMDNETKVDLEGNFPAFPGMHEEDELKMIDGFFTMVFDEDTATMQKKSKVFAV